MIAISEGVQDHPLRELEVIGNEIGRVATFGIARFKWVFIVRVILFWYWNAYLQQLLSLRS